MAGLALVLLLLPQTTDAQSSPEPFSKSAMLRDLTRLVIVPAYQELSTKSRELDIAVGELVKAPTQSSLDNARQAWVATLLAASRVRCFQAGPLADRDYAPAFFYWHVLPEKIEGIVSSPRAIDDSLLEESGVVAKGLFALEYTLFGQKKMLAEGAKLPAPLELLSGDASKRRGEYMLLLARDLNAKAAQAAADWSAPGDEAATAKFVANGQASVNLVVNQMAMALEDATEHRLRFVLVLPRPIARQLGRVESSASGTSQQSLLATVEGARNLYLGGEGLGLDDALRQVNPVLEKRVREQFDAAIAAIRAINSPLEQAVPDNCALLQSALDKTRALEILFKVDLASSLGVTLTFSSTDGD